jgi:Amylo-alpha-1,6-glucosidase
LWFNALETMVCLASVVKKSASSYAKLAAQVKQSFAKFWNAGAGCCYDVIDSPGIGNDASPRPNQIFAVSLPQSPLTPEQQKLVVDFCARRFVTSVGLRSLAQGEPGYQGHYGGGVRERDGAYHQGTVWGWLLGPFVLAHLQVYGDRAEPSAFLSRSANKSTHTDWARSAKSAMATRHLLLEGASHRPGRSAKYCGPGAPRLANASNRARSLAAIQVRLEAHRFPGARLARPGGMVSDLLFILMQMI